MIDDEFIECIIKGEENSVALFHYIIRAYISPCWKELKVIYDCYGIYIFKREVVDQRKICGPRVPPDT